MTGRDQAYWNGRFEQLEKASHKTAEETMAELEREYRTASREVEREIAVWYQRFADNNGIVNMADARKLLDAGQLKEFRWTVDEYIRHGRENGISADWRKELENASARFHISRLQALQVEMQNTVEVLFGNQTDALERMMKDTFLGQYYHTAFEVQRGLGFGWDIAGINGSALAKVITTPWATDGRNFSERIWANKTALINELRTQLSQNLLLGKGPDETIKAISAKFGVSENKTARLVYTESAYIQAVAQGDAYRELGVEHFRFIATLDDRTSDICRSMDGEVFSMKDYQPGATVPPLHPWCRSCTAPYYADLEGIGERAARDPDSGKTYFVPRDMKYKDWEQSFAGGGSKAGLTPVAPAAPTRDYSSTLAVSLGKSHFDALRDIAESCPSDDMRAVWDKYEAEIGVADIHERTRAHCDWNAEIHVDLDGSSKGSTWDKPYQTVFHESGHAIDMIAGRNAAGATSISYRNLYSYTYRNGLFPQTIKDEVDALVSARDAAMKAEFKAHATDYDWLGQHGFLDAWKYDYYKRYGTWVGGPPKYTKELAYKAIESEIKKAFTPYAKADLSDIMEGATRSKIQIGWGHGNAYWKQGDFTLATEAFAEMVDSTMANPESLAAIQTYLPKSYRVFTEMIESLK